MHRRHNLRMILAASLLAVSLLSGCVGNDGPPIDPNTIPLDAPSEGGSGPYELVVRVTEESTAGPAMTRAAVAVYYERTNQSGEPDAIGLRTDPHGRALFHLERNQEIGIVVGGGDAWTVEWLPDALTAGDSNRFDIPLYRTIIERTLQGTFEGPAGGTLSKVNPGSNEVVWQPVGNVFAADAAVAREYAARLASLDVEVRWTNGPTAYADLGIGVGTHREQPDLFWDDETQTPGAGASRETLELELDDVRHENLRAETDLYVGAGTRSGFVAPQGLDYEVTVKARFETFAGVDYRVSYEEDSPAGSLAATVAALWIAAFAVLRRAGFACARPSAAPGPRGGPRRT